jgi:ribosomal protein S18 acetylase RimI-like enzyme
MSTKPELRDYEPGTDFEEVFAFAREIIGRVPYEKARNELAAYPRRHLTAKVAVAADGRIIGFCAATSPYWNAVAIIDYLVVAPESRSRGVGQQLVSAVETELRESGTRLVCVQTASWNRDGIRFYERLGYTLRAEFSRYFGPDVDLVWLDRSLI